MKSDATYLASRLDDLEARLAHQDQANIELSDEVYRQQRQIANLELRLRDLSDRVKEIDLTRPAADGTDEIPPHY